MDQLKGLASQFGGNSNSNQQQQSSGKGDYLDQAASFIGQKTGHALTAEQADKYSDYAREGYKKVTGKDVPFADQNPGQQGQQSQNQGQQQQQQGQQQFGQQGQQQQGQQQFGQQQQ